VRHTGFLAGAALPFVLVAAPLAAQDAPAPVEAQPAPASYDVDFTADALDYDSEQDIVVARGNVLMTREGHRLQADEIRWTRKTSQVEARGNVRVTTPAGDTAYGDTVQLTDTLRDGAVENLLIVLADGGRLVAANGTRTNGVSSLERAAYTPCRVVDDAGCPVDPVWRITAVKVTHDPVKNRISYENARLELFGLPLIALPGFSHPADDRGGSGLLIPDIQYSRTNGFELSIPVYFKLAPNKDLTVTPHVYTDVMPSLELKYRNLTETGAFQVGGFATYSSRLSNATTTLAPERDFRGYLEASGKFQFTRKWSLRGSLRAVTDRTFLRRYDISRDDRLRNTIEIQRISRTSYFSFAGWAFQTLRPSEKQGLVPIALPMVDYRKRFEELFGGRAEVQLNSLAVARTDGQDTQRGFASARWDMRRLTPMGQELLFTAYARGDAYHSDEVAATTTALYQGTKGWNARAIGALAAEMRWPLIGPLFTGTQRLTPRIQLVATPATPNLRVPNEDARAVDLEDSNLFALNRFPGYDRWEDSSRVTYGLDWALDLPGFSLQSNIGQSYRLNNRATLIPDGTGLSSRTSDIVGRTTVKYRRYVSLTHRYRLDKDSLAIRRNEIDATLGTDQTYATLGYLRLNRNIGPTLEDLRDREEIRLGGRLQLARRWSVFGSTIVDLTGKKDDPTTLADGFEPVRHRVGLAYEDDCLKLSFTWRRDYDDSGDAKRGNSYLLRLSFKNLGR
jgi:LPS-assembly protein